MQIAKLKWNPRSTNILFHVLDDPGHGKDFNDTYLGTSDRFFTTPPPGRRDPKVEIMEALKALRNKCNVQK